MRNALIKLGIIALALVSSATFARNVIITNKLSDQYVVVQELYSAGIASEMSAPQLVIAPMSSNSWYIRIPALDNYLYSVKIFTTSDPDNLLNMNSICKAYTEKSTATWLSFYPNQINCDEDEAYLASPDFDPENEAFTVVITSTGVQTEKGGSLS